MTKKNIFLTGLLVVFAGVCVVFFSGWFGAERIQIMHITRAGRQLPNNRIIPPLVSFVFNHAYQLTDVKVVAASALATNAAALPLWHLISESNSVPVKRIVYGQRVGGMKPFVANSRPQPLQPNEKYRLFLKTGSRTRGEYEFKTPPEQK